MLLQPLALMNARPTSLQTKERVALISASRSINSSSACTTVQSWAESAAAGPEILILHKTYANTNEVLLPTCSGIFHRSTGRPLLRVHVELFHAGQGGISIMPPYHVDVLADDGGAKIDPLGQHRGQRFPLIVHVVPFHAGNRTTFSTTKFGCHCYDSGLGLLP